MSVSIVTAIPDSINTIQELVYQAEREPTADELLDIVEFVLEETRRIMIEDPRNWTSWDAMLGFLIGKACFTNKLSKKQYNQLVALCMQSLDQRNEKLNQSRNDQS